jgi:hypothetical protein
LVAYTVMYRSGDLAMISSILGHADRLEDDVMYLLDRRQTTRSKFGGTLFYNLHTRDRRPPLLQGTARARRRRCGWEL